MSDPLPRIPRIKQSEWDDAVQQMFDVFAGPGWQNVDDNHVLTTFAHHPALATPFLTFNLHLLSTSTLPVRLRQIIILRTAWVTKSMYMWSSHLRTTTLLGVSEDVFLPVQFGAGSPHWTDLERVVLTATEQIIATSDLEDANWQQLAAHLDRKQILDLLFTVGTYVSLGMVFTPLRVEREPDLIALAKKWGAP